MFCIVYRQVSSMPPALWIIHHCMVEWMRNYTWIQTWISEKLVDWATGWLTEMTELLNSEWNQFKSTQKGLPDASGMAAEFLQSRFRNEVMPLHVGGSVQPAKSYVAVLDLALSCKGPNHPTRRVSSWILQNQRLHTTSNLSARLGSYRSHKDDFCVYKERGPVELCFSHS